MESLVRTGRARAASTARRSRPQTVFVSHETYTPARGGSAAAEINALRRVFGAAADSIVITNTKGFTGHAMGAGIEDVVAVKALETGIVPPVPNFKELDPELGTLNLSTRRRLPGELRAAPRRRLRLADRDDAAALDPHARRPPPRARASSATPTGSSTRPPGSAGWPTPPAAPAPSLEVDQRRLRIVDAGAPAAARGRARLRPPCPAGSGRLRGAGRAAPAVAPPAPAAPRAAPRRGAPAAAAPAAPGRRPAWSADVVGDRRRR